MLQDQCSDVPERRGSKGDSSICARVDVQHLAAGVIKLPSIPVDLSPRCLLHGSLEEPAIIRAEAELGIAPGELGEFDRGGGSFGLKP